MFRFVAAVWFLMTASASSAATYNVTSEIAYGPGSLREAAKMANVNPGEDTISISAGLKINLMNWLQEPDCFGACVYDGRQGVVHLTESAVIEGNGSTVFSVATWVDFYANVNNPSSLLDPRTIISANPEQFLQVGVRRSDSSNVQVTVKNLNAEGLHTFASVWSNASLTVDQVKISGVRSIPQKEGMPPGGFVFNVDGGLTIRNSTILNSNTFETPIPITDDGVSVFYGAISGVGTLVMDNVTMDTNYTAGAIYWGGGNATIVSSRFTESGGIQADGGAKVKIVNSAVVLGPSGTPVVDQVAQIIAMGNSRIDLIASTVTLDLSGQGRPLRTEKGGVINLQGSAVSGGLYTGYSDVLAYFATRGGSFSADDYSWVLPVAPQDSAALKTLFNNQNLRTQEPGLPNWFSFYPRSVSPLLGTPATPGTLIDIIPDAQPGGANALLHPLTGQPILTDVLGNPRVDGNDRRNIGAVQLTLAPHVVVDGTSNGSVRLHWTGTDDPVSGVITGYAVLYRPAGTADPFTRVDIAGTAVSTKQVAGLTNGAAYEFKVVAVNAAGDGPDSNVVTATPYGVIQAPVPVATPGDGQVGLSWPVPGSGGRPITGYTVFFRQLGSAAWTTYHSVAATSETVHGLVNGVGYEFAVTTDTATGSSNLSPPVTATPSGPASVSLFATAGNESATLAWFPTPVPGAVSHRVEYRLHNLLNWTQLAPQPVGPVASVVSGLLNGQLYDFRVMVLDGGGQVLAASNIASVTPGLQAVLGLRMAVRNPGNDPVKRSLWLSAKDRESSGVIFGDPTTGDSTLSVIANGDKPTTQDFVLPASGWHAVRGGYRYNDPKGTNGPVVRAAVLVQRNGTFVIHARVVGKNGTVDVVPPNPGLNGGFILDLPGDGRHCVLFDANTIQHSRFGEIWQISKPSVRGCPVAVP